MLSSPTSSSSSSSTTQSLHLAAVASAVERNRMAAAAIGPPHHPLQQPNPFLSHLHHREAESFEDFRNSVAAAAAAQQGAFQIPQSHVSNPHLVHQPQKIPPQFGVERKGQKLFDTKLLLICNLKEIFIICNIIV